MRKSAKNSRGLTIVEILVSITVAVVFLTAVTQLLWLGLTASEVGRLRSTAAQLASEGVEAMYNIRENDGIDFSAGWTGLTAANEYYQPTLSVATWNLGSKLTANPASPLPSPYGAFTRTIKIQEVRRNILGLSCSGNVADSGACIDNNTRKVTVTITWIERGVQKTHRTVSLLANI